MMYEMMGREPEPILLLTQIREMDCSAANCYGSDRMRVPITGPSDRFVEEVLWLVVEVTVRVKLRMSCLLW